MNKLPLALLFAAIFAASTFSQGPAQGPGQGTGQGTGQGQTQGQGQGQGQGKETGEKGPVSKVEQVGKDGKPVPKPQVKVDVIEKLRSDYEMRSKLTVPDDKLDQIPLIAGRVGQKLTFRASSKFKNTISTYRIDFAPEGAVIDATTGIFTWTPTRPGRFEVVLTASAIDDPERNLLSLVTIEVKEGLSHFGHDFFIAPRAAILARLQAFAMGGTRNALPVAPSVEAMKNLGLGLNVPINPTLQNPPALATTGTTGTTGTVGTTGTTGTGGTAGTMPPSGGVTNQAQDPNQNGNRRDDQGSFARDPLRQIVGPFDMMNSNIMIPAPDRYQVGPGDVLVIRFSSPTMEAVEKETRVDSQGAILNPVTGARIIVRSQTLVQVEKTLQSLMGKQIRGVEVSVTLKELRSMQITVLGEAFLPGSYQVPSVATLFNVLYMVGGPSENGSLRRIELRRSDGTRKKLDLYKFLLEGDASQDVTLQPGDAIFIPGVQSEVTVTGEVGRPAIYETTEGETLKDLLSMAGGVKASGVSQRISLRTVAPGQGLRQLDIDIDRTTPSSNPPVYAGDQVEVFAVRPIVTNSVTVEGAVDQPGLYQVTEGLTVSDLVKRARGVIPEALLDRADIFRRNPDGTTTLVPINLSKALAGDAENNVKIEPYDRLYIYRTDETKWMGTRQVTVIGAVRRPGVFPRADGMTVLDLLLQSGGLDGNASQERAFLQRRNADGTPGDLINIDFRKAAAGDATQNLVLRDQDELRVQTTLEAQFVPESQVKILGAVQRPGEYPSATNLNLKDLVALAGGTLPEAGNVIEIAKARVPKGTPVNRYDLAEVLSGAKSVMVDAGDLVTVPETSNFVSKPGYVIVMGAVENPGYYPVNSRDDKLTDIIGRAGGLTKRAFPTGTQFYRMPSKLSTPAIDRLTPRIREVLAIVAEDEYNRAKARAEVDRARMVKNLNQGTTGISVTGTPTTVSSGPAVDIKGDTVTKARPLDKGDTDTGGNLNVSLPDAIKRPSGKSNLYLEEGDIIIIPETPSTVNVVGAVVVPSSVLYEPGKNLMYYVDRSGGFLGDSDERSILIIRANGSVIRANRKTRVELGDHIFVPSRVVAERMTDRQAEIDTITRNITSAGVLFAIIKSLLGK